MEKRYTLPVAIALVVGTVIGSGVFFKAEAVLTKTGGNLSVGILAFIIMGVVMIISACTFGVVAQSHEGVEGLLGYASASCGKWYGYYVGWFMAVIYYPSLVSRAELAARPLLRRTHGLGRPCGRRPHHDVGRCFHGRYLHHERSGSQAGR